MKRFRLTTASKVLILLIILALVGFGIFHGLSKGLIENDLGKKLKEKKAQKTEQTANVEADGDGNVINTDKGGDNATINLSLDEWIGWKEIIDANGGLSTQDGSIYDNLGIKVNISIINDATQSSNALISGKLDAAGYTINRTAFLSGKFQEAGLDIVMPYITNFSNGGDGIIATSDINSVEDLKNAKIGVPQFSEAHSLVIWFVEQSNLSDDDKQNIIDNLVFFETPDEAAKAFFSGDIDVAATWEPYLTEAQNMSDAHIFFSTASSSSLIMDGIVFNKDFAENNAEVVSKFIDGALQASDLYTTDLSTIKKVMPMFSSASDDDILDNCASAKLMTYADNLNMFDGTAKAIYSSMCNVWKSIGESVNEDLVNTIYDDKYITALASSYTDSEVTKNETVATVTEENEEELIDAEALLTQSATVNFIINTAKFSEPKEATKVLDGFIDTAKILDGSIIEIAGNTDPNPNSDPKDTYNKKLSKSRAETVKKYFVMNGIDADRIIVVGNGSRNPIVDNDTEEHRAMNRRTDVSFKMVEGSN